MIVEDRVIMGFSRKMETSFRVMSCAKPSLITSFDARSHDLNLTLGTQVNQVPLEGEQALGSAKGVCKQQIERRLGS